MPIAEAIEGERDDQWTMSFSDDKADYIDGIERDPGGLVKRGLVK
jgi:hypothetical protein